MFITLVPLAYVLPPDPLWIPGIYDQADLDDVVDLLVGEERALPSVTSIEMKPLLTNLQPPNLLAESLVVVLSRSTLRLRSPPSR